MRNIKLFKHLDRFRDKICIEFEKVRGEEFCKVLLERNAFLKT